VAQINQMLTTEGRALIVAGARPRRIGHFNNQSKKVEVAACNTAMGNFSAGMGHIVLMEELLSVGLENNNDVHPPGLPAAPSGKTVGKMSLTSAQANSTAGAVTGKSFMPQFRGRAANAASDLAFIRIHVLEASPGRDPDLLQGLFDLHVRQENPNQLKTALEASGPANVTNTSDCCKDLFPAQSGVKQGPC
jgi:hypothetical protein